MDGEAPTDYDTSRLIKQARDQIALMEKMLASARDAALRSHALLAELEQQHGLRRDSQHDWLDGSLA